MWCIHQRALSVAILRRAAITALQLLFVVATTAAQRSQGYYVSFGSAITAGSDWGQAHEAGFAGEVGLVRSISRSWDLVGVLAYERFDLHFERNALEYLELYDPDGAGEPVFASFRGGNDQVVTLRGGVRHRFPTSSAFKPYLGTLLGFSLAKQDRASVDRVVQGEEGPETTRIILAANNSQLGVGLSGIVGISTGIPGSRRLFLETGYTFILTPDDSFDDNPSYFPIRIGVVF